MPRTVRNPLLVSLAGLVALTLGWIATYRLGPSRDLDAWLFQHAQTSMWRSGHYLFGETLVAPMHLRLYLPLAVLVLALAWWRRGWPTAAAAGVVLLGANGLTQVLKVATSEARPWSANPLIGAVDPVSWPSGHSTASAALVVGFCLAAGPRLWPWVAAVGGAWAVAVAAAVVWMGWHMPSDAVAAWCVVLFVTGLTVAWLRAWRLGTARAAARRRAPSRAAQSSPV